METIPKVPEWGSWTTPPPPMPVEVSGDMGWELVVCGRRSIDYAQIVGSDQFRSEPHSIP